MIGKLRKRCLGGKKYLNAALSKVKSRQMWNCRESLFEDYHSRHISWPKGYARRRYRGTRALRPGDFSAIPKVCVQDMAARFPEIPAQTLSHNSRNINISRLKSRFNAGHEKILANFDGDRQARRKLIPVGFPSRVRDSEKASLAKMK
jgi:hypothetical protein